MHAYLYLFSRLLELQIQVGTPEVVLLPRRLLLPGAGPVPVRRRVPLRVLQEPRPLHPRAVEHGRHAHHLRPRRLAVLGARQVGHVRVARAVDDALGEDGSPSRFAFRDDAPDPVVVHDCLNGVGVQQRPGGTDSNP